MPLCIGIDGGATKTICAVGDETSVVATATTGGSNVIRLGEQTARENLQAAISKACAAAGVKPSLIESACVGLAGAGRPQVDAVVREAIARALPSAEIAIVADMVIAMQATLGDAPGVIVIAGTGSIAYGRNHAGETARAGGWGFAISDEGSGQWVGREAVRAVMRAEDARQPTFLFDEILRVWKLGSRDELVRFANSSPPPNFSQLFPHVLTTADQGDSVAREVLSRAGVELGGLALLVLRQLWKPGEAVRIGIVGGVFSHAALVRRTFFLHLHRYWPSVAVSFRISEPVSGALALACKRVGQPEVSRR